MASLIFCVLLQIKYLHCNDENKISNVCWHKAGK
jgi:hypothetical protein